MTTLTAEAILAAAAPKVEAVEVPEWGGTVHVRRLSAYDAAVMADAVEGIPPGRTRDIRRLAALLTWTLATPDGAPLFDPPADAIDGLAHKEPAVLTRLADAAMKLNARTSPAGAVTEDGPSA